LHYDTHGKIAYRGAVNQRTVIEAASSMSPCGVEHKTFILFVCVRLVF